MPNGYLVSLGTNQQLGAGDTLSTLTAFTTDRVIGTGSISYTYPVFLGSQTATRTGTFYLASNGNVYFEPSSALQNNATGLTVATSQNAFGNIVGTAGNDAAINGTAGNDIIYGGATRSTADNAATGADTINAGAGNDTVYAGDGNDSITGGDGNDTIMAGDGNDVVSGGLGNDSIYGGTGADSISGDDGDDYVDGGAGNDTLSGDAGNDTLLGGEGDDSLNGGIGNDRLLGGSGADSIQGGDGNDIIVGGASNAAIVNGTFTGGTAGWTGTDIEYNPEGTYLNNGSTNGVVEMDGSAGQTTVLQQTFSVTEPGMTTLGFRSGMRPGFGKAGIDGFRVEVLDAQGNVVFSQNVLPTTTPPTWTTYSFDVGLPATGTYTLRFTEVGDNDSYGALLDDITLTNGVDGADVLAGGAGDDTLYGQAGADSLSGDAGNDALFGGSGDDTLSGGAGNDTLDGGTGSDRFTIAAGDGTDTVIGGEDAGNAEVDTLALGGATGATVTFTGNEAGTATFAGTTGTTTFSQIERVVTTAQADTIDGRLATGGINVDAGAGNDSIIGSAGADTILGGAGADRIEGGAGNDSIDGGGADGAADVLVLRNGFGRDTVTNGDAPVAIGGGRYTSLDQLDVSQLLDLNGNPVNTRDVVVSADANGNAVLTFPSGDALVIVGLPPALAADEFFLNAIGIPLPDGTVSGTAGNDTIGAGYVDADGDRIDGNDAVLPGAVGNDDLVRAGAGNDTVFAGLGNDQVFGGDGNDVLYGEAGDDTLLGEAGTDTLFGGAGADSISGGDGNDVVRGGAGADRLDGGAGSDTLDYSDSAQGVTVDLLANTATGGDATGDTIANFENVAGSAAADTITLSNTAGTVTAGAGNDTVIGGTGADSISAGDGNDVVRGGAGADRLDGGAGSDTLDYSDSAQGVTVDLLANTATGGDATGDTIANFENVTGSAAADTITLSNTAGTVTAGGGNDTVTGGAGDDSIAGGDGNDLIVGGVGADTLRGDAGADSLSGGIGDDSIAGGDGNDTVSGGAGADRLDGGAGSDTLDYSDSAGGVTVDLSANTATGGDATGDTIANFENITGSAGNDQLVLSDTAGTIVAGAGDDVVIGGAGADALFGGAGDDVLEGGAGNDTLFGGDGVDVLIGGDGRDTLFGGAGSDLFMSGAGDDLIDVGAADGGTDIVVVQSGDGRDIVAGFEAPLSDGMGGFTGRDQIDAMSLTDAEGRQVNVRDVVVSDDGNGNAVLTFPGGEALTILGIAPAQAANPFFLNAMGIPLPDGTVTGTAGDDVIEAGYTDDDGDRVDAGDAILPGTAGDDDVIVAGAGDDIVRAGAGNDQVFGGTGNDSLSGGAGNDTLSGDAGNDTLSGGTGNDSLSGGDGDDTFVVASGDGIDTVTGGEAGQTDGDTLDASGMTADITLDLTGPEEGTLTAGLGNGTPADDTTVSFAEIERFFLGSGNDTVSGGEGDDVVDMGAGDDVFRLFDGFGDDRITGGTGGETAGDTLDASAVTDDLTVTLTGPGAGLVTDGVDLASFSQIERVVTGSGDDRVTGSDGADRIATGAGADTVSGGAGDDSIDAGAGDDSIDGGAGNDTILAGAGADVIEGGAGDDRMDLGAADGMADTIVLRDGSGDDTVFAFEGPIANQDGTFTTQDRLDVSDLTDAQGNPVNVADVVVGDDGNGNAVLNFPNGESIVLTGIDPVAAADPAYLGALGIPPTDGTVTGTDGDDVIEAGYTDADGDRVDGGDAAAPGADPDDDVIAAGAGNDTVRAGEGRDSVSGGDGDDVLFGGAGDDILSGDAGDDVLDGGAGRDTLSGGDGADSLVIGRGDTGDGGIGNDDFTITDQPGDVAGDNRNVAGGAGYDRLILGPGQFAGRPEGFVQGQSNSGTLTLLDGSTVTYTDIEGIICFTPGTRIATPKGARDIATLAVGDLVMTRDHGLQPIRWIQSRTVRAAGRFAPIRIRPGVLTGQDRDLLVSPQHRMLFQGYRAELLFGETEVLVAARHLVDGAQVTQEPGGHVTYIHMMFDAHEIVFAEGAATESFHPGTLGLDAIHAAAREELFAVFPELRSDLTHYGDTARRCLKRHEAELLRV